MMYLDGDPIPNDLVLLRKLVVEEKEDMWVSYHGEEYCISGAATEIWVDFSLEEGTEFKDFDEMLKAPIFEGKCLPEIIDEIDVTY